MGMIDEERIEAINREIDGLSTPEESAELRTVLASDEEARTYFEDIARLGRMLSAVQTVEPPPGLKTQVMAAVRAKHSPADAPGNAARAGRPTQEGWLESFLAGFRQRGKLAYAFTFAAGLAVGMVAFGLMSDSLRMDRSQFTGTMIPSTEGLRVIDQARFEEEGFQGSAITGRINGRLVAEIELASTREVSLTVGFDRAALAPQGIRGRQPVAGEIVVQESAIRVNHSGENRYVIEWERKAGSTPEITFVILDGEKTVRAALRTSPGGD